MSINDLTKNHLSLLKKQKDMENELNHILKLLNYENTYLTLLHGRDYWVRFYNRKLKEYKEFSHTNTLKTSIFMKVIK